MSLFRFEDSEIWKRAIALGGELCVLADVLDAAKKWKFAVQLRSAALSMSNNIAEGSGSTSSKDFGNFLNIAKRSVFENANMMFFSASTDICRKTARCPWFPNSANLAA